MMDFQSVLPPNATVLERALEKSMNYNLNSNVIKTDANQLTNSSPDLLTAYALGFLKDCLTSNEWPTLQEGLEFLRTRGTPHALRLALGWLGITDITLEEGLGGYHFAEFQLGQARVLPDDVLNCLLKLVKMAIPIRSRCRRIYNAVNDQRYYVLSHSSEGLLSDDSGVKILASNKRNTKVIKKEGTEENTEVITISFGRILQHGIDLTPTVLSNHCAAHSFFSAIDDPAYLDCNELDAENGIFSPRTIFSSQDRERVGQVPFFIVAGVWHLDFSSSSTNVLGNPS